jgi:phage shock protein PspC (stress-responsive transcriptional regulator)
MSWIMSIAAGLAIGYFVYQMVVSKNGGVKTTGRIHKSVKDRKIAGVCGGIAEYLNADPTIIRLAFALMVLGWGTGVLAYIACALILPEGDSEDTEEE